MPRDRPPTGRKPLESRIVEIGPKLKDARKKATLSLRVLAARTGFSASFLSQVELGQVSPSLASLEKIAAALGVQLAGLFSNASSPSSPVIHRHDEGVVRSDWSRGTLRVLLSAWPGQPVSAMLVALKPGGQSGKSPHARPGRAFAFCVSGTASLATPDETFELSRGDSICYETSSLASIWRNTGSKTAEILIVSLPG
jgi:XRE family transcriptional regulator, regulator of sulfur utilization